MSLNFMPSVPQGMKAYSAESTLNRMFSSGTITAKEKMLKMADSMLRTTAPAR